MMYVSGQCGNRKEDGVMITSLTWGAIRQPEIGGELDYVRA